MRRTLRLLRGSSRGVTLIEVLVAMALVGIIAAAFLGGLSTASRSAALADIRTNAESLARTQMEFIKSQTYSDPDWDYELTHTERLSGSGPVPKWWDPDNEVPSLLSADYAGYTVTVTAQPLPREEGDWFPTIQQITVTIFHHSSEETPVFELTSYKTNVRE